VWLEREKPDAVSVIGFADAARVRVLGYLHRKRIPHFIFGDSNVHGDFATGLARVFKTFWLRRMIGRATGVLCCGQYGDQYFQRYGSRPEATFYVPQEPDYDEIASVGPEEVAAERERYGFADGRRRIVFAGRLVPGKRVDQIIDAFARIADERPQWDVVIIGSGPLEEELRARVPERLRDRFLWTGFIDEQRRVAAIYKSCDLLCLPSTNDAWALVVNEAAACGLAIIVSDAVGAGPELVRNGENGWIFRTGDLDDLVRAFRDATDPARIDRYKAGSVAALADWCTTTDPVDGYRKALLYAGLKITHPPPTSTGGPARTAARIRAAATA
jgi:glycosyltransferase involved in cell wall biosynthesis